MGDTPIPPGPWGLLLYHPQFAFSWSVHGLGGAVELVMGLALALAVGLAKVAGFGRRDGDRRLVGVAAAVRGRARSYTIWFGFPDAYTRRR